MDEYTASLIKAGFPEGVTKFFAGTNVSIEKGGLFDSCRRLSQLIGRPATPLSTVIADALSNIK